MGWGGKWHGQVTWGVLRVVCARRLTRRPAPSSCGAGGREEGLQDGGGEVGRARRRFCRRRRLRSCRLRLLTGSRTRRSSSFVGSDGESKSLSQPFSSLTLIFPDSLPLPPRLLRVRGGAGCGGRRPLHCSPRLARPLLGLILLSAQLVPAFSARQHRP